MPDDVTPWITRAALAQLDASDRDRLDRACRGLATAMGRHLSGAEPRALLTLGVALARMEWPFLVRVEVASDGGLSGFALATEDASAETVHAAGLSILEHSLRLFATLEGDECAREVAEAAWGPLSGDC